MATRGKSINLFLMDSEASGRIKCTLANWTGVAYKIPRTELDKCLMAYRYSFIERSLYLVVVIWCTLANDLYLR